MSKMRFTPLDFPLNWVQIAGVAFMTIMNTFAVAGGVGGGGIVIPILMIFMKIPISECVPITNAFGLIVGLTRFIYNFKQMHPYRPWRKIVDYEIVTLTMPMVYFGSLIGVQIGGMMM